MKLSAVSQLWFVVESTGILFLDYVIARDFPDRSGRGAFFSRSQRTGWPSSLMQLACGSGCATIQPKAGSHTP
jgi:hypothetical protein